MITSNKWMRANYGKSLRKFLSNLNPKILIDLGPGVFSTATVDTNILLIQNSPKTSPLAEGCRETVGCSSSPLTEGWQTKADGVFFPSHRGVDAKQTGCVTFFIITHYILSASYKNLSL